MILTADLRMYRHSGIGRYLRNLFPLLLPLLDVDEVHILANASVLRGLGNDGGRETAGGRPEGMENGFERTRNQFRHTFSPYNPASLEEKAALPRDPASLADPRVRLIETSAPIYSIAEQRLLTAVPTDHLLWVPHFNVPIYRQGPMVVTVHDVAPLAVPQILSNPLKRGYAKLLIKRAVSQASAILCASNFTRDELVSRLHVPAEKMTVTHLGLDRGWPTTTEPHLESDAVPYLLYVGNIKPNKNLTLLLSAFASVQDLLPYRLILAGKLHGLGTGDAVVLRQAKSLGDRIRFVGEVDDAHLKRFYAGAAALVLPSLYEGFGLPLLEAMSLGCPVLSSTAGSLPEIAGEAALYFDPHSPNELASCLLRLQERTTVDNLRALGRARLHHFSFHSCAQQTATVINRHLSSNA